MFIDIHCHLDMIDKDEKEIRKIIENADKKNVLIITQGVSIQSNRKALELVEKHGNVKCALGLYPIDAINLNEKEINNEIKFIENNKEKIIAIGEVGLDFKEEENEDKRKKQIETFRKFIKLSIKLNKPIIVHSRKAEAECIQLLEKENAKKVVMHCFNGNFNLVEKIVKNGWYLTIPTNVTRNEHFQKIIEKTPINQLFCETDSPYLHPNKEWPNVPANVIVSYEKIAQIKGMKLKDAERAIEANFDKVL